MMKLLTFALSIFLCCLLFSCHPHSGDAVVNKAADTNDIAADSFSEENVHRPDLHFQPVYELSPRTVAITFTMPEQGELDPFDSLFADAFTRDSLGYGSDEYRSSGYGGNGRPLYTTEYDLSGYFRLMTDSVFERRLKLMTDSSYFVYGTKGFMECRAGHIIYFTGSCGSQYYGIVAEGYDKEKCGHPLFSYPGRLPLHYDGNYKDVQDILDREKTAELHDSDNNYKDHIYPMVFANIDTTYFSYCDDFKWTAPHDSMPDCLFPQRMILRFGRSGQPEIVWTSLMDNFGIPCD